MLLVVHVVMDSGLGLGF
uniref:Uncharacterized protein n=1 Tax=Rhizophora mucronata TaxID=61149 RepID=A0A2P2R4F0_RHIMU